jgi:hypothetical protein
MLRTILKLMFINLEILEMDGGHVEGKILKNKAQNVVFFLCWI